MAKTFGEVAEELKWQEFIQAREASTKKAHPKAKIPKGCSGCAIGQKWTETDDRDLLLALKDDNVTIESLCRAVQRSESGIIARLRSFGLLFDESAGVGRGFVSGQHRFPHAVRKFYLMKRRNYKGEWVDRDYDFTETLRSMGWMENERTFLLPDNIRDYFLLREKKS